MVVFLSWIYKKKKEKNSICNIYRPIWSNNLLSSFYYLHDSILPEFTILSWTIIWSWKFLEIEEISTRLTLSPPDIFLPLCHHELSIFRLPWKFVSKVIRFVTIRRTMHNPNVVPIVTTAANINSSQRCISIFAIFLQSHLSRDMDYFEWNLISARY